MAQTDNSRFNNLHIKPLSVHIGAEISGVDLTEALSNSNIETIRDAFLKWRVIFFRDQHLTHKQHIDFARSFGELTPAHVVFGSDPEYPEIYPVTKSRASFAARPGATRAWTDWHTDVTSAINPPFASILRGVEVPPFGGDTHFTSMVAAYKALSTTMQTFISSLRAVHQFKPAEDNEQAGAYNKMIQARPMKTEHPLVTVHPETGEASIYTSQEFTRHIVGLDPRESDMLLEFLWEHCMRPEFTVRFKWEPGSIAFWDNRSTQHQAIRDVYDTDFDRIFYRVTLNGTIPKGIDGQPSRALAGDPIIPVTSGF
ncbi:MAG: alpha-ketoglutarate-dependent taurine dioxygenase [Gammaproteobacteria bacterium]|jgi:alpha-ketoglutarate-dependent taurine dioxygenase